MFAVRTIHPAENAPPRVEAARFDLEPQLPQGKTVCNLFAEFLAERPGEFREKLPFVNKLDIELQWAAAGGGAAFAALFHEGRALAMAALLGGADPAADEGMIEALGLSILAPMFGEEFAAREGRMEERPGVLMVQMNEAPELIPTSQLLMTALASVYFRAVQALASAGARG
ncbi:MAG: hypothetical protein IT162_22815 [Bryobacterales bacterium]|nr:hypothetical protein [Bryobacterales bacterium]